MNASLPRDSVTLEDKYRVGDGWVYLTGIQALTRLPIQQRLRDQAAGLNTGGFISGYRGSPLGRYDMELWSQAALLRELDIHFVPGVNEDLAATSACGAQYIGLLPGSRVDGVFSLWYGKGPGTDRSADALRHLSSAGSSRLGGVLAIAGDDHGVRSSSIHNYSDPVFMAVGMPVLQPSNTQELLDLGLHGIALSRYSGCAVGFKVHADVVEGGGSVHIAPDSPRIVVPTDDDAEVADPAGRNIRILDTPLLAEERLVNRKLPAAIRYARANRLNRIVDPVPGARIGILAAGKSFQDAMQALAELNLTPARREALGLRVGKIGMTWPLDPEFVREFATGLEILLVVEEKRGIVEDQAKAILYDLALPKSPRIVGKYDGANAYASVAERGAVILQAWGELTPSAIARTLVRLLREILPAAATADLEGPCAPLPPAGPVTARLPGFCSGCPHNRSTKVPDGSRAMVGIGCHAMAMLTDPAKTPPMFTQMGGEGMHWVGQAPFTTEKHVFANMGDGTYFHSGLLAVRQAIAAKVTMTYKILVNGFVSMTGGQPIDGELTVPQMVAELRAEGVRHLYVVTDDIGKYGDRAFTDDVQVSYRTELDTVMKQCRTLPGVSVIVYDQACATARRRLRKRGDWVDPAKRTFINAAVCEGCGDCSKASNCLSIEPLETPLGRKRQINQSSCNKDFSCVEGFCPSFVTVHGGKLRKKSALPQGGRGATWPALAEPTFAALTGEFSMLVTGIGGTGVVTIAQVLGMAAHLDGLACSVLDVTGLAQKYGAVMSHIRLAPSAEFLHAARIGTAEADTMIGCDLVVTASDEALDRVDERRTRIFVASDVVPTSDFSRNPDWQLDAAALHARIDARNPRHLVRIEALRIASQLMGDTIATNMFMLGLAWQSGAVPLSLASIRRAIELNGVGIEFNQVSFDWGRRAAADSSAVEAAASATRVSPPAPTRSGTVEEVIARSEAELTAYQDQSYARRYRDLVDQALEAERAAGTDGRFARAVAQYYFKLLAFKDEFEVARLYASDAFRREVAETFEGDYRLHFHVGAWPFASVDSSGNVSKREVGPWLMNAFSLLARFKRLRGTWLDPFRNSGERRVALACLGEYELDVSMLVRSLSQGPYEAAVAIASLPEGIRGYGHVRERHIAATRTERERLLQLFQKADQAVIAPVVRTLVSTSG